MSKKIGGYKSAIEQEINEIINLTDIISEDQLYWKPSEEEWSVMEVLSHVEEVIHYWVTELKRVITSPGPWGRGMDAPARLEALKQAHNRKYHEAKVGIVSAKAHVLDVFTELMDENLAIEAPHRNPKFGVKSMDFLVEHFLVDHLQKHIVQIKRVQKQYHEKHVNS
jgi:uncharacterized damage-inducible protein DinB